MPSKYEQIVLDYINHRYWPLRNAITKLTDTEKMELREYLQETTNVPVSDYDNLLEHYKHCI